MSWATYEDYVTEIPVITAEPVLCIECHQHEPEDGTDHCKVCLNRLNAIGEKVAHAIASLGTTPPKLYQPTRLSAHDAELQHRQAQARRLK